jgi:diguanylate cyclase (GGDEF)-like protein
MKLLTSFEIINIVDASIDKFDPLYKKVAFFNILLMISASVFIVSGLYYIFISPSYIIGWIELFSAFLILIALYRTKNGHNIKLTMSFIVFTILGVALALIILRKSEDYTLIWTMFAPMTTIYLYGTKKGSLLCALFYAVVFYVTYQGVDIWQNGAWNMISYVRFVSANITLAICIYILESISEASFISLQEKRKQEKTYIDQLTYYSNTDSLTELYNRRYLDQIFSKNFKLAAKSNSLYVFAILNLDFFKRYNDTYGHKAGDKALIKISKILENNMKQNNDYAFRISGAEFACLMIAKNEASVFAIIEKTRQEIENTKLATASFGVCIIDKFDYEDFDEMYRMADIFIYEAKEKGKNQVVGDIVRLKQDVD